MKRLALLFISFLLLSCGDDETTVDNCSDNLECLTNNSDKIWILSNIENVPKDQWTACMLDTELTFRSNGSWQKNCPGIQDNGIWYFNGDETKITAVPGIGSGFHGDSAIYDVVRISDNTFQFSCVLCLPGYDGGVETLRAK